MPERSNRGSAGSGADDRPTAGAGADVALADEESLLARYAGDREERVREELVRRFLPLARGLAGRYEGRGETRADLDQVASLGLVKALERFDPDRGSSFASYATPTILGEIRRHFRDRRWAVHVPRDVKEAVPRVRDALDGLYASLGRSPSVEEVAREARLSVEDVLDAMEAASRARPSSLDAPRGAGEEGAIPLEAQVGEVDPAYETVEDAATIGPRLARLSERDREVLRLRLAEDMTQSQIAERIGVSQMQVSRILRAAIERLREE